MSSKESEDVEKNSPDDDSEEEKKEDVVKNVESDEEFESDDEKKKVDPAPSADYIKHLTYEGDKCIYTEPNSGRRMVYDNDKKSWCEESKPENQQETALPDVNQPDQNYEFDGQTYVYTDKNTNVTYKYDYDKKSWVVKDDSQVPSTTGLPEGGIYGFENDSHTYTDPKDGSVYIFDKTKKAWFPKVDDDFLAMYQINYGFVDPNSFETTPEPKVPSKEAVAKKEDGKRKAPQPATWFDIDEAHNTSIYVSGLPLDVTHDEITEVFLKCGLLARDEKGRDKIKLYTDESGEHKGDALCTYIKRESVDLALNILDGWQIRGHTLSVQRAKFQLKGEYNPALKPKRRKRDKDKQKKIHERLFDWRPDKLPGEPLKSERVVVIKNCFKPEDFNTAVEKILLVQEDLRSECAEKCGEVKKVVIYDRNPDGVAQVFFKEPEAAEACVKLLNNRWYAERRITAEIWDGKTKYKIAETDEQFEARLKKWEKHLEQEDEAKAAREREENAAREREENAAE